jgi:MFS transporter, Spinster family, sphingosine-1-phosphate transporter
MRPSVYKYYLLGALTVILIFSYVDRVALGIVLEDLKADLQLSDTQLGFLSGIAFALFYSIMGVPIARWADRGNRVAIISLSALLWSVAVALSGTAGSFVQLVLIRVAVAVGEAGCIPPSYSLMADYFGRAERPRATAIYGLGGPLCTILGYFFAGWLNEEYGWRITFVVLGLPGLALAALAWFTLKEPRLTKAGSGANLSENSMPAAVTPSLKVVAATLWSNITFRRLLLCVVVMYFFSMGIWVWQPAFLMRSYGLTSAQVGMWLALLLGLAGLIGAYLGGELASRYAANNERLQLKALASAFIASGALTVCVYLTTNLYWALTLMGLAAALHNAAGGPVFATIQTLVPDRMRALAFSFVYLMANLIGAGFGPLTTGLLSDVFAPWAGHQSLRYALLALTPGYLWMAWYTWRASQSVQRDLEPIAVNEAATAASN